MVSLRKPSLALQAMVPPEHTASTLREAYGMEVHSAATDRVARAGVAFLPFVKIIFAVAN
jgi:hypothetical protein